MSLEQHEAPDFHNLKAAWKVLGLTSLAVFAASLDSTVLFVAFSSIRKTFSTVSVSELSWVLNGYTIVFAALLVLSGRLADQLGHRCVFLTGVALFTFASILCGISPTPTLLIAARVLQAIGGVLLTPASLALVLDAFPHSKRSTAVSLWGAVGALAAAIGPSLGAVIVQTFGWRWAFFLNLPVGIVAIVLGRQFLRESRDASAKEIPDLLGVLLSILAIGLMALGIVESDQWNQWYAGASLLAGVLLLALFLIRSSRVRTPALDLKLFQSVNYRFANLATFVFYTSFTATFFGQILFLTQAWGYSTLNAGLAITPAPLTVAFVAPFTGRIADRSGHRILIVPGGLLIALGGLWLLTHVQSTPAFWQAWVPALILLGLGVGLCLPSINSAAVHSLPQNRFAVGSAVNQAIRQLGSVLGVALVVALVGKSTGSNAITRFDQFFVLLALGGLLTSLAALGINTRPVIARDRHR